MRLMGRKLAGWALLALAAAASSAMAASASAASTEAAHCPSRPEPSAWAQALRQAPGPDRGLLWRVRDGQRTSWLYGSMHVGRQDWGRPGPQVTAALQSAEVLALEINVLEPAVLQQLMQGFAARADAPPLPPDLQAGLAQQRDALCAPEVARQRPDAQLLTLMAEQGRSQGLHAELGSEMLLLGLAQQQRKPVVGLESVHTQLAELISDDPQEVEDAVRDGLRQLADPRTPQIQARLADGWARGDLAQLERFADWCDCVNTERERLRMARLMEGRNPGMASAIAQLLQQGQTVFAAVGALHMVGPQGLPELLRQQGYRVERVHFDNLRSKPPQAH